MQGAQTLELKVSEWPTLEDIKEFTSVDDKEGITEYLQKEFDAYITMRVGNTDLLAGYTEAFILPVHALIKSLSGGLRVLATEKSVRIPIYLQQYDVEPGSRAHFLHWRLDQGRIFMRFEWGGYKEAPAFIENLGEIELDTVQAQQAIADLVADYIQRIAVLLRHLGDWSNNEIEILFEGF
ncbi:MAG: hypothetical protein H6728_04935 [Myxococcales bacterium]|nr:hypothetical protein [Myxococcales bacterium]MCB9642398.1 hypothetical protein [Myxococcales bacterium]